MTSPSGISAPSAPASLRIASRRSQLAMVQTHWVRDALTKAHPGLEISIEEIGRAHV